MRKILSFMICAGLVCILCSCAYADYQNVDPGTISKTLTSTTDYVNALTVSYINKASTYSYWGAPFNGSSSNQRAVVRIYEYGNPSPVSSTWVYSSLSYTKHPYKTGCQTDPMHVFLGAKVDDRDYAPLTISGNFYANKN